MATLSEAIGYVQEHQHSLVELIEEHRDLGQFAMQKAVEEDYAMQGRVLLYLMELREMRG